MEEEIWQLIPSIPGLVASSLGRIMVVPHLKRMPHGGLREYGGKPVKGVWDGDRHIYFFNGKTYKVARLICEAFNGPPAEGECCLHKDENSRNNLPSNLKWGTQKENLNAPGFLAYCRTRTGENHPRRKQKKKATYGRSKT